MSRGRNKTGLCSNFPAVELAPGRANLVPHADSGVVYVYFTFNKNLTGLRLPDPMDYVSLPLPLALARLPREHFVYTRLALWRNLRVAVHTLWWNLREGRCTHLVHVMPKQIPLQF